MDEPRQRSQREPGTRRAHAALLVAALALVVLGAGAAVRSSEPAAPPAEVPDFHSLAAAAAPAPPASSTTTTEPPPPPPPNTNTPVDPPRNPYKADPDVIIGSIEIPRIGLAAPLRQGISLTMIDRGPSHWPGTALPGQTGNVVVAGHRVTRTRPFRHIDQLQPGDPIIFEISGVRWVYRVTEHMVVPPSALHIVDQGPEAIATLFACHPPGSARYRYVVRAALEGPEQA